MRRRLPRTPFSTPFSPSKKMVEERIRGVIAGPQKRPPLLLLVLVFAFCFFSVNLVSCQSSQLETEPLMSLTLTDGGEVFLLEEKPRNDQEPLSDTVAAIYYRPAGGVPQDLGALDYGPNHHYWLTVSLETFTDVLGSDGFILNYQTGTIWNNHYYYSVVDGQADLMAACYNKVWQEDLDNDGELELLNNYDAAMGYLDVYDRSGGQVTRTRLNDYVRHVVFTVVPDDAWVSLTQDPETGDFMASWMEEGQEVVRKIDDPAKLYYIARNSAPYPYTDLNQNGIPEEIRLENEYGGDEVRFYEDGQLILRRSTDVYLCSLDGTDYILYWYLDEYQGDFRYGYDLARFDGEFQETQQWNAVQFDTNFNALFHKEFDPEAIAAFVEELNDLLSHSIRLSAKDGALLAEDAMPVELDWLDGFPDVFVQDPDKSLLENLQNFRAAMPQDLTPPVADQAAALPGQSYALMFCSGAGAWQTTLTLQSDGHFEGYYEDADMNTHYVCQFHGRFGNIVQVSGASFYMTLEELVLDTKRPLGGEWDEGGIHYISSAPYGLTGADGEALKLGAGFIFYLPEATGHAPGTELYGAADFLSWLPDRSRRFNGFNSASDTLDCYGLYNLATGYGFFDLHAWSIA